MAIKNKNTKVVHAELGAFWKNHRINAGLSQTEVANYLSVGGQYVSNYERGLSSPSNSHIKKLIKLFRVDSKKYLEFAMSLRENYLRAELGIKDRILTKK